MISTDNTQSYLYDIEIDDIGNLGSTSIDAVNWAELPIPDKKFWGFKDAVIVYNNTLSNARGKFVAIVIGSTDIENGSCNDAPMFFYRDAYKEDNYWISWDPAFENCRNLSAVMDHSSNIIYGVCEIQNGSNKDLLFFNDNPTLWHEDSYLINQTITSSENLMHPNIFLKDDNIYIAAETDTQGLVLFTSSDDGENWETYNITSPGSSAKSPNIFANESYLSCFYVESGNLSVKTTINHGENWTEPAQINDVNGTVDSGYRNVDIGDMNKLIWTDTRDGNKDLYYLLSFIPTVDVAVTGFSIEKDEVFSTFNWISIKVKNVGDAPATGMPINVTYTCEGGPNDTGYPGYVQYIDVNETVTILRPLFRFQSPEFFQSIIRYAGLENITVHLDIDGVTDDTDPANNIYQKQISYEEIFPKLGPFENFFKTLKSIIF
jgi:hypothetical protein